LIPSIIPISLEPSFLRTHGREETEREIRQIVRSVQFELMESENALRLMGPKMDYHYVDPYLPEGLRGFGKNMTLANLASFRSARPNFDLCFEDSWSGYFIARQFEQQDQRRDLVLIHLDTHTDMMATLLCWSGKNLVNPALGAKFDPASANDWKAAIHSGAVNIGNFITPFFYSGCMVHVRHINNLTGCDELLHVLRELQQYQLIPDTILANTPRTWTILHIDLDYFINDFDGTSRGTEYVPDVDLQTIALEKVNRLFNTLSTLDLQIDRWIIATSPGFCSAYHWDVLLSEIDNRIQNFKSGQAKA
jgi:hypothetical protein